MAASRKGTKNNPVTGQDKQELDIPEYVIIGAKLNDGKVDFSFRMQKGIHQGEVTNTKGAGIFFDSLQEAFNMFAVHLAVIDEAYKHKGVEIEDIDMKHTDELETTYAVSSFKIMGEDDAESIVLIGSKYTALGDISIQTPKIPMDGLSSYKWYNELKTVSDQVRAEVASYKEGNFEVYEKEDKPTSKQLTIAPQHDGMAEDEFKQAAL